MIVPVSFLVQLKKNVADEKKLLTATIALYYYFFYASCSNME